MNCCTTINCNFSLLISGLVIISVMAARKEQQLRVGMKRTYSENGVKVVDQLQATGSTQGGRQVVRWVRITRKKQGQNQQVDIMDLDGGLGAIEQQKDILDVDGGMGI
jgi:hypothetical protein